MDWIESVSRDEFVRENVARKSKEVATEPRTLTVWTGLPYSMGFCTVPGHEDVQRTLNPEQLEYRQKYPTRWVIRIGEYDVCRDCFMAEADKDG